MSKTKQNKKRSLGPDTQLQKNFLTTHESFSWLYDRSKSMSQQLQMTKKSHDYLIVAQKAFSNIQDPFLITTEQIRDRVMDLST